MRLELYNINQARWLPRIIKPESVVDHEEELMSIFNFTNYDITYTLVEDIPIMSVIIYPFKTYLIRRLKTNQHAILGEPTNRIPRMIVSRKDIKNKLVVLTSHRNPYKFAPGFLGNVEGAWARYLIPRGDIITTD